MKLKTSGRFWKYKDDDYSELKYKIEWGLRFKQYPHIGLNIEGDCGEGRETTLGVGVPCIGYLYFTVRTPDWLYSKLPVKHCVATWDNNREFTLVQTREIRISWFQDHIHWSIWCNPDEWSSKIPWWQSGGFFVKDKIFGRTKMTKDDLGSGESIVTMLEGSYPVAYEHVRRTWKRSRLPWNSVVREEYDIKCEMGIPFPGKGENSWDCDDDGLFGTGFQARSVSEACGKFGAVVLDYREKYGGRSCAERPWPESPEDRHAKRLERTLSNQGDSCDNNHDQSGES